MKYPEFLVALPIAEMPVGEKWRQGISLPLHCTLMPWFSFGNYNENFPMLLEEFVSDVRTGPFTLVSEKPALFGPHGDVPVHVLQRHEKLNLLHTQLLVFLAKKDAAFNELKWVGAGYHAHVSNVTGASFATGATCICNRFVLIGRDVHKSKVAVKSYNFAYFDR